MAFRASSKAAKAMSSLSMNSVSAPLAKLQRSVSEVGWWGTAIKLYTIGDIKFGVLKGTDKFGNKYYEDVEQPFGQHRWVEYADIHDPDASMIQPEWHGWMHHMFDETPDEMSAIGMLLPPPCLLKIIICYYCLYLPPQCLMMTIVLTSSSLCAFSDHIFIISYLLLLLHFYDIIEGTKETIVTTHVNHALYNTHIGATNPTVDYPTVNLSQRRHRGYKVGSLLINENETGDEYYKQPGHPLSKGTSLFSH